MPASSTLTRCRIGFCDRNVKPRSARASSTVRAMARSGVSASSSVLRREQDRLLLHLGVLALLLDRTLQPLEPAVDHLEIGEDQLELEVQRCRVRDRARRAPRQGTRAPRAAARRRCGTPWRPAPCARPSRSRQVHHLEGGVRRLLGLEQIAQAVHARVGHAGDAGVHLASPRVVARGGDARAGEQIEQCRLAALGETDEPDLHRNGL